MDIATIVSYAGIIVSVLWTAFQEIRFQIDKVKKTIITSYINSVPVVK